MLPHYITLAPPVARDKYGNVSTWGTAKSYKARVVGKLMALRNWEAEQGTQLFTIYVDAEDDVITTDYQLVLPDDPLWGDRTPVIFTVGRYTDETGQYYTSLQCGWEYHRQGQV